MAKLTTAEFIEAIKELSVLELNDLVKACEEEFGVSAAAGVVSSVLTRTYKVEKPADFEPYDITVYANADQVGWKGTFLLFKSVLIIFDFLKLQYRRNSCKCINQVITIPS